MEYKENHTQMSVKSVFYRNIGVLLKVDKGITDHFSFCQTGGSTGTNADHKNKHKDSYFITLSNKISY